MARGLDTDRRCTLGKPDPTRRDAVSALALWKRIVFPVVPTIIVLVLTESVLALLGVTPRLHEEDPFVGFASQVPLYVESTNDAGQVVMTTSSNKRTLFNAQTFLRDKPAGTTRIFCLGGSTTYGRPYYDATAFSGWLRALLPVADPGKHWEVINAGGISYASYRVATVMEELTRYDPDVFIVYTGHNEFLEERTYGTLRD
ncbi:MAG: SGNH/GDSL hydrolase family protein, partial [Candidatus Eisenbacteria bacterium]|nr:SGNH/GDSL hydrolase family protein [Candidatus Eisenbacteria bacterium]